MDKLTIEQLQEKHASLLEKEGSILCTEDGQAFYNTEAGRKHAQNYSAVKKVKFFEVKAGKVKAKAEAPSEEKPKKTTKKTKK